MNLQFISDENPSQKASRLEREKAELQRQLADANAEIARLQSQLDKANAENSQLRWHLLRIVAVGSTGTIFQSDFEYAVDIAKQALKSPADQP